MSQESIDLSRRPQLGGGFRLQWEPAQNCHVLLYPEGMVKLNQSAGEILTRCNAERSIADIVSDLEQAFQASGLSDEVVAFLNLAKEQKWVSWS